MVDPNTRQSKRTPVTLKIKFKSETLAQFIERYAVDVSQGGIFIRTKEPLPAGTPMRFEFQLKDASPLIAGEGTVVWTRENDPTRPGVAPGMGVRFDRLAEGSQEVLDRILAEKAKQSPSRHTADTKPPINAFAEVPTRVAPSPLVNALAGESGKSPAMRGSGSFGDTRADTTPLPNPMPFHSDAEDFPDEAFEEATKVRPLDELVAQSAAIEREQHPPDIAEALDELAQRRAARTSVPPPTGAPTLIGTAPAPATRDGASRSQAASTPPGVGAPRLLDTSPSPRTTAPPRMSEKMPVAAVAEPLPPPPVPRAGSRTPMIVILVLIAAAAGAAAVWFLVLRKEGDEDITARPGSGQLVAGSGSARTPGSGTAVAIKPGSGAVGSGATTGSAGAVKPAADLVEVAINSNAQDAVVEVVGTDQKGPAPFRAKLEKGATATIRVTAPGFVAKDVEVTAGDKPVTVALVAMARILHLSSTPSGAQVFIDNGPTGKVTPVDLKLSTSQAGRAKVRVTLRKPGYQKAEEIILATAFAPRDDKMVADFDATLVVMRSSGSSHTNTGSGSASGTGSGSATTTGTGSGSATTTGTGSGSATTTGTGSGSAATTGTGSGSAKPTGGGSGSGAGSATKPATGSGSAAGTGGGSAKTAGSGTGEPTPDWMK